MSGLKTESGQTIYSRVFSSSRSSTGNSRFERKQGSSGSSSHGCSSILKDCSSTVDAKGVGRRGRSGHQKDKKCRRGKFDKGKHREGMNQLRSDFRLKWNVSMIDRRVRGTVYGGMLYLLVLVVVVGRSVRIDLLSTDDDRRRE